MAEWARWIPGGEVIGWSSFVAGVLATLRLLPRAGRWCFGLLLANVRLALVTRERDILRTTVNTLMAEREQMGYPSLTSGQLPGSLPNSSGSTLVRTPKP